MASRPLARLPGTAPRTGPAAPSSATGSRASSPAGIVASSAAPAHSVSAVQFNAIESPEVSTVRRVLLKAVAGDKDASEGQRTWQGAEGPDEWTSIIFRDRW